MVQTALAQRPITISVFNESTTIPFSTFYNQPLHPGLQLGTELAWKESRHFRLYPAINLGYMFHKKLFQGVYANLALGLDIKSGIGLNLKTRLGLGYLHTFTTQQEFQFTDGRYQSRPDGGNARLIPSFSLGFG